jgi:cytochrome c oxidase subunit II
MSNSSIERREIQMGIPTQFFALVLAGVASVATGIAAPGSAPQSDASAKTIEVSAKKYEFNPGEIRVAKGTRVELKVHSVDDTHGVKLDIYPEGAKDKGTPGLVFDHPDQNGKVTKGADQVLDFVAQVPGTYDFKCAKFCGFGHDRMKGKLIVE